MRPSSTPFNSPYNRLLHLAAILAAIPWLYSYYNFGSTQQRSFSIEKALVNSWDKIIQQPSITFRRAVIGINCNVDLIVSGTALLDRLNLTSTTSGAARDHAVLKNADELRETFTHFFSIGAPTERYLADKETFAKVVATAESSKTFGEDVQYHIGGNAALMAQRIATSFPRTSTVLVGPIGPRSQALLHPFIVRTNSTRIVRDEIHIILEYKQGEVFGDYIAPASSRFITSHDALSGSAVMIDMFFKTIALQKPDLVVLSGVHLLQFQKDEMRLEKLRVIKRNLLQINRNIPIHLQLGSMADAAYMKQVLHRIIPNVDSLGVSEQELALISQAGNGPYTGQFPVSGGSIHVHKVVEMLHWLLTNFGEDRSNADSPNAAFRLQRIHFHCLTYQIIVSRGNDWSNLAAALAAGARLAGRQVCNIQNQVDTDLLELRTANSYLLDKEVGKVYTFHADNPLASWMRGNALFIYTPVLVCKYPIKTVGTNDAISATALMYSQFYRLGGSSSW